MYMSERERYQIIEYFKENTYYSEKYLEGIKNHAQLFSMYKRTQERMATYPKEIIAYYKEHPEIYNEYLRDSSYRKFTVKAA